MKDKIFLDTILDRNPHATFSNKIISLCEQNQVQGFTSSLVIANLYYIIRNVIGGEKAIESINKIRAIVKVLPFRD